MFEKLFSNFTGYFDELSKFEPLIFMALVFKLNFWRHPALISRI